MSRGRDVFGTIGRKEYHWDIVGVRKEMRLKGNEWKRCFMRKGIMIGAKRS